MIKGVDIFWDGDGYPCNRLQKEENAVWTKTPILEKVLKEKFVSLETLYKSWGRLNQWFDVPWMN